MAHSETIYRLLSERLGAQPGLSEKKMFGGVCFMLNGNMLCGSMKDGAMIRVGKDRQADATAMDGVDPIEMGGRRMGGFVRVSEESLEDEAAADRLFEMAFGFVNSLPAK